MSGLAAFLTLFVLPLSVVVGIRVFVMLQERD
jgi:hypothetical protein